MKISILPMKMNLSFIPLKKNFILRFHFKLFEQRIDKNIVSEFELEKR